ncbi:MAG: DotD/TraH family lipoprotein [Paracoccaceae bacterium]|nr:DotD/TraH family lipoprotein [Paracoccaceae bacterium]MDE2917463.1 DotD/TraH family lipoprotein [Paracoccaceae bacterium]
MVTRFTTIFLRSIRGFLLWGSLVFLIGCSSSNQWNEPPPIEEPDSADLMILNAVANISENIRKLETNDISLSSPTQPQPMDKKERLIDIKWNGPLETLLLLLSQSYDREVEILGNRPMTPVMINLSSEDSTLEEIIKTIAEHDTLPDWVNLSITPDEIKLVYVSF